MNIKDLESLLLRHKYTDIKIKSIEIDIEVSKVLNDEKRLKELENKLKSIQYTQRKINILINRLEGIEKEILNLKYLSKKPTSLRAMARTKGLDCRKLIKHNKAILLKVNKLFHGSDLNWGADEICGKIKFISKVKPLLEEAILKETDERLILDDKIICRYFNVTAVNLVDYLNKEGLIVIGKNGEPIITARINGKTRRCLVIDKVEFNKYIK